MKLKDILWIKDNELNAVTEILQELVVENLVVDLEEEDLEKVLDIDITDNIVDKIAKLVLDNSDSWDYFDIMKILNIQ